MAGINRSDLQVDAAPDGCGPQPAMAASGVPTEADIVIPVEDYPPQYTEDQYDVLLIYAEADKKAALKVKEILQRFIVLRGNTRPNICDMGDGVNLNWIGGEFAHFEEALKRSTFTFIYMSKNLVSDAWAEMTKDECLMQSINNPEKRWCVVPLYPKKRKILVDEGLKIPFGLNALKGAHLSNMLRCGNFMDVDINSLCESDFDPFFLTNMSDMLTKRLYLKNERKRQNAAELENWLRRERRRRLDDLRAQRLQQERDDRAAEEEWQRRAEASQQNPSSETYEIVESPTDREFTPKAPTETIPQPPDFTGESLRLPPPIGHHGDTHIHYHINDASQLPPAQQITYNLNKVHQAQIGTGNVISAQNDLEVDGEVEQEAAVVMETDVIEKSASASEDNNEPLVCELPPASNGAVDMPIRPSPSAPENHSPSTKSYDTPSVAQNPAASVRESRGETKYSAGSMRESRGETKYSAGSMRESGGETKYSAESVRESGGETKYSAGSVRESGGHPASLYSTVTRDNSRTESGLSTGSRTSCSESPTNENNFSCISTESPPEMLALTPACSSPVISSGNTDMITTCTSTTSVGSSRPVAVVSPIISAPITCNITSVSDQDPSFSQPSLSTNTSDSFHLQFEEPLNEPYPFVHTLQQPEPSDQPDVCRLNFLGPTSEATFTSNATTESSHDDDDDVTQAKQRLTEATAGVEREENEGDNGGASVMPSGGASLVMATAEDQAMVVIESEVVTTHSGPGTEVHDGQEMTCVSGARAEVSDGQEMASLSGAGSEVSDGQEMTRLSGAGSEVSDGQRMTHLSGAGSEVSDGQEMTRLSGAEIAVVQCHGESASQGMTCLPGQKTEVHDGQAAVQSHDESASSSPDLDGRFNTVGQTSVDGQCTMASLDPDCTVTRVMDSTDQAPRYDCVEEAVDTLSSDAFASTGSGQQDTAMQHPGDMNTGSGRPRQPARDQPKKKKDDCCIL